MRVPRSWCRDGTSRSPTTIACMSSQKLARVERLDRTIYRFDVELEHERNRRQRKNCQHVEITARGRGPVVRGEGVRTVSMALSSRRSTSWRTVFGAARTGARSITATRLRFPARGHSRRAPTRRGRGIPSRNMHLPRVVRMGPQKPMSLVASCARRNTARTR